ncbi:MAG TPA: hypothetical protein VM597_04590, partial [Gemmataceae bacterium]|nr:hypothetical protein [Gemmataceae bacterium]
VDVVLEYLWAGPATEENRRRRLLGWSRYGTTPRELLLELDAAGTGFTVVPPELADLDDTTRTVLDLVRATPGLTAWEIHLRWPSAAPRPGPRRIQEVLHRLAGAGDLTRTGRPHPADPYRYHPAAGPVLDPVLDPLSAPSPPVLDPPPRKLSELTDAERLGPAGFAAGELLTARSVAERYGVSERLAGKLCARWLSAGTVTLADASTKGRRYRVVCGSV